MHQETTPTTEVPRSPHGHRDGPTESTPPDAFLLKLIETVHEAMQPEAPPEPTVPPPTRSSPVVHPPPAPVPAARERPRYNRD
jgi:hypothetical protein